MVTLWHFVNPLWFERRGAFLWRGAKDAFLTYVRRVCAELGEDVECWITLNEPNVYAVNGYFGGGWPPLRSCAATPHAVRARTMARSFGDLCIRNFLGFCRWSMGPV